MGHFCGVLSTTLFIVLVFVTITAIIAEATNFHEEPPLQHQMFGGPGKVLKTP
jgi:hypothetical protein